MRNTLGMRIRDARIKAGFTQEDLAKRLNITPPTLSKYENGHRIPHADFLERLVEIVECDPAWLLTGKDVFDDPKVGTHRNVGDFVTLDVYAPAKGKNEKVLFMGEPVGVVQVPRRVVKPTLSALLVEEPAMSPTIVNKAVVLVDRADTEVLSGCVYALWLPVEGVAIRRVFVGTREAIIKADNPVYPHFSTPPEMLPDHILGRVKWIGQEL